MRLNCGPRLASGGRTLRLSRAKTSVSSANLPRNIRYLIRLYGGRSSAVAVSRIRGTSANERSLETVIIRADRRNSLAFPLLGARARHVCRIYLGRFIIESTLLPVRFCQRGAQDVSGPLPLMGNNILALSEPHTYQESRRRRRKIGKTGNFGICIASKGVTRFHTIAFVVLLREKRRTAHVRKPDVLADDVVR